MGWMGFDMKDMYDVDITLFALYSRHFKFLNVAKLTKTNLKKIFKWYENLKYMMEKPQK